MSVLHNQRTHKAEETGTDNAQKTPTHKGGKKRFPVLDYENRANFLNTRKRNGDSVCVSTYTWSVYLAATYTEQYCGRRK